MQGADLHAYVINLAYTNCT